MSNPTECGASSLSTSNFTTQDEGKSAGTAQGNMSPNCQVSINGSTDLSAVIVGNNGAYVQSITFESFQGIARDNVLYIYGKGPEGMGSGSLKVTVNTTSGKTHDLSLTSSSLECHSDKFEGTGNITSISWTPS